MSLVDSPTAAAELQRIRADFPSLRGSLAYFDSVASSLTPRPVIDAIVDYYENYRANVHRGSYDMSLQASERFEQAIRTIAGLINAGEDEIVLTQNTTHAINLAALTIPFERGDEIVLSSLEHTSNMAPWMRAAGLYDLNVRWYKSGRSETFDLDRFADLLTPKTKVVALAQVSNVIGTTTPVGEIGKMCRERGIFFVVDGAQSVPHMPVDVRAIDCDFLAFSGHKMLGPTGVGVLYVRRDRGETLMPAILGGGTIDTTSCNSSSLDSCVLADCSFTGLPHKWQAGTPPIAETLGLAAAVDYLQNVGFEWIAQQEQILLRQMLDGFAAVPGVDIHGPKGLDNRAGIVSFNVAGLPPEEVGRILSENYNIAVRAGQHCAVNYFFKELHDKVEHPGNVRAGLYLYNTTEEVDRLVSAVGEIAALTR
ncbi:cysteine desulfurase [Amycolatopsis sp. NPDC051071]|uniref:aminotransferase class V-fold PLP-dependent enzyme n=1 Tax=Amycolatopsis sp. NPDC051071 TaxID=3154637 RepID=UPI003430D3AC